MPKAAKPFLFLDGEGGNNADGSHDYMVLCGWSDYTGELILRNEDNSPLGTVQILDWLLDLSARLKSEEAPHTFIGFGLGYDVAMMLKDISERPAMRLYRPDAIGWVTDKGTPRFSAWHGYAFQQLGSKFTVLENIYGEEARATKETRKSICIWDIWKFFQGSFVKALTNWKILSKHDLDRMERMKKKRSTFSADEIDQEIIDYCLSECRAGVALMTKLNETCLSLGYNLAGQYHGAGSLAASMLKAWEIDKYQAPVPPTMARAVSCAYFGGRFEIAAHGWLRTAVWQYDINSAYPHIIQKLPCLACAKWRRSTEVQYDGIYETEWKLGADCKWGPLPHRNSKGEITYPNAGRGWYWGSEILSARRLYGDVFSIRQGWSLDRKCSHVPFAEVPKVYRQRRELGSSEAGEVLKLGLNSLYGKTAQSVGTPKYANYIWAGMITAGCRAMILDAIRIAGPEHVLMTATDAIVTDCPVILPGSKEKVLGEWDESHAAGGMLIIQPGITVSYDDKGTGTYKSRGLGKAEFAKHAGAAEQQWDKLGIYGAFTAESHRFIGIKTALARNDYDSRCRWVDAHARV